MDTVYAGSPSQAGANLSFVTEWRSLAGAIGPVRLDVADSVVALAYQCVDGTFAWIVRTPIRTEAGGGHADEDSAKAAADDVLVGLGHCGT